MTIAQELYSAVTGDPAMGDHLVEGAQSMRFYARGTLGRNGVPAQPEAPYVMYAESGSEPAADVHDSSPNTGVADYTFYTYDVPGSFERIKAIQKDLRRVVEGLSGTTGEEGMIVTEAAWTSTGGDQYDTVTKMNVKTQEFRIVGKV